MVISASKEIFTIFGKMAIFMGKYDKKFQRDDARCRVLWFEEWLFAIDNVY